MEKQGMDCGRKIYRAGLLIMKAKLIFRVTLIFLFLFPLFFLHAQEDADEEEIEEDPGPEVITSVDPVIPVTGRTMTISIIIDYPVPEEVNVIAPPFTDSLILDRIVKNPRVTETQVLTVVEYRLIPVKSGRVTLDSFTVVCPAGITESDALSFNVRGEGDEQLILTPRLAWEEAPRQIPAGDRVTLVLRASGWNSSSPAPEFFMPPVPQGVIIALLPLSEEERAGGIAVKLTLIPLNPGSFRMNSRTVRHENVIFSIPSLNIQITGSSAAQPPPEEDNHVSGSVNVTVTFPDFILTSPAQSVIRETHRLQCRNIYDTAKNLWDSGLFAKSLAELRRNERDHPAGALLQPLRRQAEESLGIFITEDENRQRRKTLSAFFSFILFFVIIAPFVCLFLIKKRNSLRMKMVLLCAVVFSAALSFFFYRLSVSMFTFHGKGNLLGVTKETPVRRMADIEGEGVFNFREGQPVVILLDSGSWVYVRANDALGFSGWIPAEAVEFY